MATAAHILVVEDDAVYRKRLCRAFQDRGLLPCEASDLAMVREALERQAYEYAVIDLRVGEESGLEALKLVSTAQPDCRAVMLTGYGTIATTVHAIKEGAVNYLTKPADPDSILAALREQLSDDAPHVAELPAPTLSQVEWNHIHETLERCNGNVTKAAQVLGMHRRSLQRKLSKNPGRLR